MIDARFPGVAYDILAPFGLTHPIATVQIDKVFRAAALLGLRGSGARFITGPFFDLAFLRDMDTINGLPREIATYA
jgi:hypothetical protein